MQLKFLFCCVTLFLALLTGSVQAAPAIFHSTESAGPGDVIGLEGDSFGSAPQVFLYHVVGTEASLNPATLTLERMQVVSSTTNYVSAVIPAGETTGLYAVWVYDGTNYSAYALVNAARAWGANDLCGTQIDPSRSFRLFGRNLYLGSGTPTVTFVNGSTSLPATVTTTGSDTNVLHVTAPAGLVNGTVYTVNVNNGYGGTYGTTPLNYQLTGQSVGSDPFGLGVPWGSAFTTIATHVYNVKLSYGAYGDGVHDDSLAIQNAINAASNAGGGIVYFPAGTYQLSFGTAGNVNQFLTLKPNVVLQGEGSTLSTLVLSNPTVLPSYNFGIGAYEISNIGIMNLGIHNLNTASGGTSSSVAWSTGSHFFVLNSKLVSDSGKNLTIGKTSNVLVKNSTIVNTATMAGDISEPVYLVGNTDVLFSGNAVSWYFARVHLSTSTRTLIENNTLTRDAINNGTMAESGGLDVSFSDSTVVLDNTIDKGGSVPLTQNNDGETIMDQWSGAPNQDVGTVTSATSTTLSDSTKNWTYNYAVPDAGVAGQLYYVAIIGGPGMGQFRYMTGNTTTTLTVDHPWQVVPTSASHYTIVHLDAHHHLIKGNSLSQNTQGIEYYATSFEDVTFTDNTLTDNGGIWMRSDYRPAATASSFQINMDSQIFGNTISNPSNLYSETDSYSRIFCEIGSTNSAAAIGTNIYGVEIRDNTVTAPIPNRLSGIDGEGYTLRVSGPAQTNSMVGMLGVIFQDNTAINTNYAFHLCTGDSNTTIWDNNYTNVGGALTDIQEGSGTITHASLGTEFGSLVGDWNFDTETAADSSGNQLTGTLYGSPDFSTDVPYTTLGNTYSLQFDKTNHLEAPNAALLNPNDEMTIAFWMKADSTGTNYERPLSKNNDTAPGWEIQLTSGTTFLMRIDTSAGSNQLKAGITGLLDNNWHHIAYVINRGTVSAYKDGVLVSTGTYLVGNGFGNASVPLTLGSQLTGNYGFLGNLDDVRLYDKALTSAQITALYDEY